MHRLIIVLPPPLLLLQHEQIVGCLHIGSSFSASLEVSCEPLPHGGWFVGCCGRNLE